ncbi:hypothetical protein PR202_ga20807 [Eleusine coracana subsp. coracana]|uniref:F-box domain-containing protein n=1 Tax=Eleusine coracana subsp. coracana TaxID=191504 RepID=A0AAV5CZZ6_ELECO|nr:hypothetical protein PR202_ga20807 [Eleusine coracana subsp. coracana]
MDMAHHCYKNAGGEEDDRISGLPDEHLHSILLLLGSTTDAACTSVLSRRWRHVWTHLPELSFRYEYREKDSRSPSPDVDPELSTLDDGDTPVSPSPPPDPSSLLHDFDTLVSGSLEDHFCIRSSHAAARLVKLVLLRHDRNDDDDPVVSDYT